MPTYEEIRDQIDTALPDSTPEDSHEIVVQDINDVLNVIVDKVEEVENSGGGGGGGSTAWGDITGTLSAQTDLNSALALKAPLASPTFTGTPAAPTATAGTSTTQLATTAFVAALGATKADIASPALTGNPTAPTQTAGNNTTRIATTAFVTAAVAAGGGGGGSTAFEDITGVATDNPSLVTHFVRKLPTEFYADEYGVVPLLSASEAANTTAFAAMLTDIYANKGGEIILPWYGKIYGKINIPATANGNEWYSVTIRGCNTPPLNCGTVAGAVFQNNNSTILTSLVNSGDAIINIPAPGGFKMVKVNLFDFEVQTPTSTAIDGVNVGWAAQAEVNNLFINSGIYGPNMSPPYTGTGLIMPYANNGGQNRADVLMISGFNECLLSGEHLVGGHITLMKGNVGIKMNNGTYHPNYIARLQTAGCRTSIAMGATGGRFTIAQYVNEHHGAVEFTDYDLYDPSNLGRGSITYAGSRASIGAWDTFIRKGGANVKSNYIGDDNDSTEAPPLLTDAVALTTSVYGWGNRGDDVWESANEEAGICDQVLVDGEDSVICFKHVVPRGFYGLQRPVIGILNASPAFQVYVYFNSSMEVILDDNGTPVNTAITAIEGNYYGVQRISGVWTAVTSDDEGATWDVLETAAATDPGIDLDVYMYVDGSIYYPQMIGGIGGGGGGGTVVSDTYFDVALTPWTDVSSGTGTATPAVSITGGGLGAQLIGSGTGNAGIIQKTGAFTYVTSVVTVEIYDVSETGGGGVLVSNVSGSIVITPIVAGFNSIPLTVTGYTDEILYIQTDPAGVGQIEFSRVRILQ